MIIERHLSYVGSLKKTFTGVLSHSVIPGTHLFLSPLIKTISKVRRSFKIAQLTQEIFQNIKNRKKKCVMTIENVIQPIELSEKQLNISFLSFSDPTPHKISFS